MAQRPQPSIQDVANLAGVSLGTVSNVLNYPERVKESTLKKVERAIEQLGFVRNDAARQLKAGRSRALGLVVLDVANPFFVEVSKGAQEAAAEDNFQILLGNSDGSTDNEANYLRMFHEQRLSGVLLTPTTEPGELVNGLRSTGTRIVLVDWKANPSDYCSVSVDDVAGGKLAVKHLIGIGRKRIAFVGGSLEIHQVADRYLGAQEAINSTNGKATLKRYEAIAQDVTSGRDVGNKIAKLDSKERPDAIFAANDLIAVGLLQAFTLSGKISVPDEIALIGYDDIDFAASTVVPMSSIKQPAQSLGSAALELLVDEINNPESHKHQQITFQPELVVRESTTSGPALEPGGL